jgi:hypothetical protein
MHILPPETSQVVRQIGSSRDWFFQQALNSQAGKSFGIRAGTRNKHLFHFAYLMVREIHKALPGLF